MTVWATGSGLSFIHALGSESEHTVSVFGAPLWISVLVIVAIRFVVTAVNVGSDLPCCFSVPMMAMGAGLGMLMSLLFQTWGMDPALSDALIVVCLVTFFVAVVKAPITGIIMTVELTWSFSFLLPAIVGVAVGYVVGDLFRTEPLYEKILEEMLEEERANRKKITATVRVTTAAGRNIRDILWPVTALVTEIIRGGEHVAPGGNVNLQAEDLLTIEGMPADADEFVTALETLVGEVENVVQKEVSVAEEPPSEPVETE